MSMGKKGTAATDDATHATRQHAYCNAFRLSEISYIIDGGKEHDRNVM